MEAAQSIGRLSLWQISEAQEALAEKLVNAGGEITPELEAEWESLAGTFDQKAEGCALYVRELMANAAAAKEEADRLQGIHEALANRAKRLKTYLHFHMERTGRLKVSTSKVRVWVQANGGRPGIRWTLPAEALPAGFRKEVVTVDTQAVHDAHAKGALPAGFVVEAVGTHLRIS